MQRILFVSLLVLSLAVIVFPLQFDVGTEKFEREFKSEPRFDKRFLKDLLTMGVKKIG